MSATRALVIAAAFVVVVAGMRAAEAILVPFLLSVFLAVISAPPLFWLQERGLPKALAMLIVVSVILALALLLGALIGNSLDDFSRALPGYQERLKEETTGLIAWLSGHGIAFDTEKSLIKHVNPGAAMKLAGVFLDGLGGVLTNAFLILLTVIFILFETSGFPNKLHAALADPEASLARFEEFSRNVKRYLAIKTSTSLLTGVAVAIGLWLIGVDYPVLWGVVAFLLNFVPNIGSILAAVPAILLALIQIGLGGALWAAAVYAVVNGVIGNVVEPRFLGRGLGLSTLIVFLSLVFWGWVLGPVGMFLSVPLTMTVKIALESSQDTRWLAVLLGPDVARR